jgi:hypothetical protein
VRYSVGCFERVPLIRWWWCWFVGCVLVCAIEEGVGVCAESPNGSTVKGRSMISLSKRAWKYSGLLTCCEWVSFRRSESRWALVIGFLWAGLAGSVSGVHSGSWGWAGVSSSCGGGVVVLLMAMKVTGSGGVLLSAWGLM